MGDLGEVRGPRQTATPRPPPTTQRHASLLLLLLLLLGPLVNVYGFAGVGRFCTEVHHAYVVEQEFCELRVQGVLRRVGGPGRGERAETDCYVPAPAYHPTPRILTTTTTTTSAGTRNTRAGGRASSRSSPRSRRATWRISPPSFGLAGHRSRTCGHRQEDLRWTKHTQGPSGGARLSSRPRHFPSPKTNALSKSWPTGAWR